MSSTIEKCHFTIMTKCKNTELLNEYMLIYCEVMANDDDIEEKTNKYHQYLQQYCIIQKVEIDINEKLHLQYSQKEVIENEMCCLQKMQIDINGINLCDICGKIKESFHLSVVENFITPPKAAGKSSRHFDFWMDCILAENTKTIPPELIERILNLATRDNIPHNLLYYNDVRPYLKLLGETKWNDYVPLILRHLNGRIPPRLTYNEKTRVELKFNQLMEKFDQGQGEKNRRYYPYFIYKVLESEFCNNDKKELLDAIHFQSNKTVINNDKIYEQLCKRCNENGGKFIYKPTDVNALLRKRQQR